MMDLSFFDLHPRFSSMEASTATILAFFVSFPFSMEPSQGGKSTKQELLARFRPHNATVDTYSNEEEG